MAWVFEGIDGPGKGMRFEVSAGQTLGRSGATHVINDSKISSIHAKIRKSSSRGLILTDMKSTNGLKVGKEKVPEIVLEDGLEFRIGRSIFRIIQEVDLTAVLPDPIQTPAPAENAFEQNAVPEADAAISLEEEKPIEVAPPTWDEYLASFAKTTVDSTQNQSIDVQPFRNPVQLQFLRGAQVDTTWTLGFGPRQCGPASADCPLLLPDAPGICFELFPDGADCRFETSYPDRVSLNGKSTPSKILKDGDRISIDNILIEVHFSPL